MLRIADVQQKQQIVTNQLLNILEVLENKAEADRIADALSILAENVLPNLLQTSVGAVSWQKRLSGAAIARLQPPTPSAAGETAVEKVAVRVAGERELTPTEIAHRTAVLTELLHQMLQDLEPLTRATALYALHQLDTQAGQQQARQLLNSVQPGDWLVQETAERIVAQAEPQFTVPTLIVEVIEAGHSSPRISQKPAICIGRSLDSDVVLTDPQIAMRHAVLYFDEVGVSIAVLSDKGRVWMNDRLLEGVRQPLQQPAILQLSESPGPTISVRWEQPASADQLGETPGTLEKLLLIFQIELFRSVRPEASIANWR